MSDAHRRRSVARSSEMLVLRDSLGMGRRRKTRSRDPEKRALLLDLALRKIEKAERDNFTIVGVRGRRVRVG
ncbi:MAG: hypothetical protein AB1806_16535 [Acidobacteriota bacterium]